VSCLEPPNRGDIHGGHLQADGGNIAHGKVFIYFKKNEIDWISKIFFG
jgi:hypothetical protein